MSQLPAGAGWNADRTMYYGTREPDLIERVMLEFYSRLHWLRIGTLQSLRAIQHKEAA